MEVVDNLIMLASPARSTPTQRRPLLGRLSFALAIAFVFTVPVNRWLLARGKGTPPCTRPASTAAPASLVGVVTAMTNFFGRLMLICRGRGRI